EMAGLLPITTSFAKPKLHLGYRKLTLKAHSILGPKHSVFRAHEFHYSRLEIVDQDQQCLFAAKDAVDRDLGDVGMQIGSVCGSYMHLIDAMGGCDENGEGI
ncbi:MAG: hypothetical protein R3261_12195, partial [Alphaproteobacteria bacterium]|nr:hypothetical protein [Alphaproteobacteria bacterium]